MAVKHKAQRRHTTSPGRQSPLERAVTSTADKNDLPDHAFAFVEDGEKDETGRTTPRSKRHLPYKNAKGEIDKAHLRNALARIGQTDIPPEAKAKARVKLEAAAREAGVGDYANEGDRAAMPDTPQTPEAVDLTNLSLPEIVRQTESIYRDALAALGTPDALEKLTVLNLLERAADDEGDDAEDSEDEDEEDKEGDEDEEEDETPPSPPSKKKVHREAEPTPALTRAASVTTFAPPPQTDAHWFVPLNRVDAEKREIEGVLSDEQIDTFGTQFDYDSMKRAVNERWHGNVREQHDPKKAVGKGVLAICDDASRQVVVRARISKGAEDTWQKILDGTLSGFSIGAANAKTETRMVGDRAVPCYKDFDLAEISVVDAPSNPGAAKSGLTIYRSAAPDTAEYYADALEGDTEEATTPAAEASHPEVPAVVIAEPTAPPIVSPVAALQADPIPEPALTRAAIATHLRSEDLLSGQPNMTTAPEMDHAGVEAAMNGESGYTHLHSHPYDDTTVHANDHTHEHTDGTLHKHAHTHGHVGSGDGSRPHLHKHEHDHVFRSAASDLIRAQDGGYHLNAEAFLPEGDPRLQPYLPTQTRTDAPAVPTAPSETNGTTSEAAIVVDGAKTTPNWTPVPLDPAPHRTQEADLTRYGARLSGDTRMGMHEAALAILRTCNCPTCQDAVACYDPDMDGDDDVDAGGDTDGDAMPRAQRAQLQRAVGQIVATSVQQQVAPVLTQFRAIAARLATTPTQTQTPELTRVMEGLTGLRDAVASVAQVVNQMAEQEAPGGPILRQTAATLAPDKQLSYRSADGDQQFTQQDLASLAKMARQGALLPQEQTAAAAILFRQQHR